MEVSEDCSVKVAVHIRPLIGSERVQCCKECVIVTPGQPQVQVGSHSFTFDHVHGNDGSPSSSMFEECVAPLVDGLFQGYNGTVLAYGQTGSGKTHTMGTNYKDGFQTGLIPQVMNTLFSKIQSLKQQSEFHLRVSFIEILNEEVRDLLDSVSVTKSMTANGHSGKVSVSGRSPVQIRELSNGVITLAGSSEVAVCTLDEMVACLERGSVCRATGSTNMNHRSSEVLGIVDSYASEAYFTSDSPINEILIACYSLLHVAKSRSHAIFTITLEQMRKLHSVSPVNDTPDEDMGEEYICAKLHLVDLAGSERAKRTGSDVLRLKEGININRGLLALGNVISALGDEKKRKGGVHVPYRDSKLTRLLQDSLGGNSKTVMIACISPADINAEETLNTLKYANRARNIQNKPVVNRDLISSELQQMRQQLKHLQDELSAKGAPSDEVKVLKRKIARLEASNEALSRELHEYRSRCSVVERRKIYPQGGYADSARSDGLKRDFQSMDSSDYQNYDGISGETSMEIDEIAKEWEHTLTRSTLDKELHELNRCIQRKESELKLFGEVDTEASEQHFRKKITEFEEDERVIQQERDSLLTEIENRSANSDDQALKTQDISQNSIELESQVDLLKQKQRSEATAKQLLAEIQHIKAQKVQLQHKMKVEAEQFRQWRASREKEVQQLIKEGRRNDYKRHKLEALHQRQKLVLQKKTEEAAMATRRLKVLLEACKSSPLNSDEHASLQGNDKSLRMLLDHELEVMVNVHEVHFQYEKQKQEHSRLEEELALFKQADQLDPKSSVQEERNDELGFLLMSPCSRMARISSLENMLSLSSNALLEMASQLSEAEEKERSLISPGCWNQLRSMGEAKNLLQYMFTTTAEARCQMWDKDMEIKDLTDQMKDLINLLQQSEAQIKELVEEQKAREQAIAIALAQSVSGSSCSSSTHNLDDLSGPLSARSLPTPKQLKFSPGVAKSVDESAAFLDHTQKIVLVEQLSMKKLVATGQTGKLWRLVQFKWKWQKPWKLSEWMKHSDETIMKSRPYGQFLVDMI